MAKFYEEIAVDKNLSVAEIYLEFLGKKHHLATKTTRDSFHTIDVEYYNDILDYSLEEDLSGYTVYDIMEKVHQAIGEGSYREMHNLIDEFNTLECKAREDIKNFAKAKAKHNNG